MKRLVLLLVALFCGLLTSCSWFDSKPIEPKVIGVGYLQYDAQHNLCFVVIDSTQYTISQITIADKFPRTFSLKDISPTDGTMVTVFTSDYYTGVQAVTGEQSVEQIEDLFRTNALPTVICPVIMLALLLIWLILTLRDENQKEKAKQAQEENAKT